MPVGSATLNFGAIGSPTTQATIAVTGQTSIIADSKVEAWLRVVATAEHPIDELTSEIIVIVAGNISAGVGFTIYGQCIFGVTYGTYTIDWVWL